MADYLVFFGSSEGFNCEVFDKEGINKNFNRLFPDFEHFESKLFSTDRVDNKPILAKYKLKIAGKSITLLKYYTFAQSSFSSRIEGSNIGVAFLSENDIQLSKINYILLKNLLLKFQQKSLNNNKFITGNFSNEALAIFQEFKDTSSFSVIEKKALRLDVTSPLQPFGFFMHEINEEVFKMVPENIDRVYLTADKDHLKRAFDSTSGRFNVWFVENNKLISLREQNEIKKLEERKVNQIPTNNTSSNTNYSNSNSNQNELLKSEFNQLKNKYKFVLKKKKLLTSIVAILSILLLISLLFNIFKGADKKKETATSNTQKINTTNVQLAEPAFNDIAFSFMDSIVNDKEKLKNFTSFLLYINNSKYDKISSVTFDQFDEVKLNIETYGILKFDETFFKKHKIDLTKQETLITSDKKNNIKVTNPKKSQKKDSINK
jgi:hypothetical protein